MRIWFCPQCNAEIKALNSANLPSMIELHIAIHSLQQWTADVKSISYNTLALTTYDKDFLRGCGIQA
jgi:hypothetical protein